MCYKSPTVGRSTTIPYQTNNLIFRNVYRQQSASGQQSTVPQSPQSHAQSQLQSLQSGQSHPSQSGQLQSQQSPSHSGSAQHSSPLQHSGHSQPPSLQHRMDERQSPMQLQIPLQQLVDLRSSSLSEEFEKATKSRCTYRSTNQQVRKQHSKHPSQQSPCSWSPGDPPFRRSRACFPQQPLSVWPQNRQENRW